MRVIRGAAIPAAATAALLALAGSAHAAGLTPGCASGRPAVAYEPGAGVLPRQPRPAPVPCLLIAPGRAGESAMVAVTKAGRLLYAPIVANDLPAPADDRGPALVDMTDDGGAHWQQVGPGSPDHILDVPPWMTRDPATGRIWVATVLPPLCGTEISWSDDDGRTWQTNPAVGCPSMGSLRTLEGPAPAGGARPSGYAHVVYACANANDLSNSNLWCYRSLDGGKSFAFTGGFPDPAPTADCQAKHPARPGIADPEGVLYFPVFTCGQLSVAISRDEGATWTLAPVAKTDVQDLYISSIAADGAGNLYLAWIGGTNPAEPMLAVSRDHGKTWSAPVDVAPPGVAHARHVAIEAEGSGRVAVSFLGTSGPGPKLDGYLAASRNALAARPLWWAAPLNDPATPLLDANDSETFGDRLFNFADTFAPDGDPWAAFHCAKLPDCPAQRVGVLGRLAWPHPKPSKPRRHRHHRRAHRRR